jgi:hypothetical protein
LVHFFTKCHASGTARLSYCQVKNWILKGFSHISSSKLYYKTKKDSSKRIGRALFEMQCYNIVITLHGEIVRCSVIIML